MDTVRPGPRPHPAFPEQLEQQEAAGHGAAPSGWAWGAEVKASSCLTAVPLCLLPGPEECSFLSQPDPEDPTGRKSPGLARVGLSGLRPWGCRSLAVWPRASDCLPEPVSSSGKVGLRTAVPLGAVWGLGEGMRVRPQP